MEGWYDYIFMESGEGVCGGEDIFNIYYLIIFKIE